MSDKLYFAILLIVAILSLFATLVSPLGGVWRMIFGHVFLINLAVFVFWSPIRAIGPKFVWEKIKGLFKKEK